MLRYWCIHSSHYPCVERESQCNNGGYQTNWANLFKARGRRRVQKTPSQGPIGASIRDIHTSDNLLDPDLYNQQNEASRKAVEKQN